MQKGTLVIVVVVVLILLGGGYFLLNSNKQAAPTPASVVDNNPTQAPEASTTPEASVSASDSATQSETKTFTVTGSSFKFAPNELKVNKGDKVKVVFKNSGGMHDFVIDEFSVKTQVIKSGQEETVEFTASKAGTFEFYCSVGDHRAMGMKGNLIVQ